MSDSDRSRLREIWRGIRKRCYNKRCKDYRNYGGRGIRMHPDWRDDFDAFYDWAMSNGYRSNLTIDRVAVNRDYMPGNCRWVSRKAQANNRTTNTRITIDGHTRNVAKWSKISGTPDYTIVRRLAAGWSPKDAVYRPSRKTRKANSRKHH